jgi:FMN phosphatase YigB (HAD superfamily)
MQTIVWDIDDVLNSLMRDWFTHLWLPQRPACGLSYEDLRENPPHRVLHIECEEYLASLDAFRGSPEARAMQPNPDLLEWFRAHGREYRHVALTARPLESAPHAAEWLFRHFGAWFRCFGVVPTRPDLAAPRYDRNKADFLRWLDAADYLVDDSPVNIEQARALGLRTFLYPQPWNAAAAANRVPAFGRPGLGAPIASAACEPIAMSQ